MAKTVKKRRTPAAWFKRYFRVLLGLTFITLVIIYCIVAPMISKYDPYQIDLLNKYSQPTAEHIFGTDELGRDYFARLAYGGQLTILIALASQAIVIVLGTANGILCANYRRYDDIVMRLMEAMRCLPNMLTTIMIASLIGQGFASVLIAIVISGLPGITKSVRAQTMRLRALEFIEAEKAMGASAPRVMFLHMLPQLSSYLLIRFGTGISSAMMTTASLAYLGIGLTPEMPNWGGMISSGQSYMLIHPHLIIYPGIAIIVTMFGLCMLGEGLRDVFDPKYR